MKKLSKKEIESTGIKVKNPFKQLLCEHEDKQIFTYHAGKFYSLRGEQRVIICKDCGKQLGKYTAEFEGNGYK